MKHYPKIIQDQSYYLQEIKFLLHGTLSPEQEQALTNVLSKIVRVPSPKMIDLNIPFRFFKRFYIQLYFGVDKRTRSRKERDKFEKEKLKDYYNRDAEFYFLNLPDDIQASFKFEEKRNIKEVFGRAIKIPSQKIFEQNITFKLKQKYYLTIFLGFDKRKGRRKNINTLMNTLSFAGTFFIYLIVILFILYFAKTVLNYDLIEGSHGFDYVIEKLGLKK